MDQAAAARGNTIFDQSCASFTVLHDPAETGMNGAYAERTEVALRDGEGLVAPGLAQGDRFSAARALSANAWNSGVQRSTS